MSGRGVKTKIYLDHLPYCAPPPLQFFEGTYHTLCPNRAEIFQSNFKIHLLHAQFIISCLKVGNGSARYPVKHPMRLMMYSINEFAAGHTVPQLLQLSRRFAPQLTQLASPPFRTRHKKNWQGLARVLLVFLRGNPLPRCRPPPILSQKTSLACLTRHARPGRNRKANAGAARPYQKKRLLRC